MDKEQLIYRVYLTLRNLFSCFPVKLICRFVFLLFAYIVKKNIFFVFRSGRVQVHSRSRFILFEVVKLVRWRSVSL